jgi:peptide deformylase
MKIVLYTETPEILETPSETVIKFDKSIINLVNDMFRTIDNTKAVGLAAVQIGVLKKVLAIKDSHTSLRIAMINPEILEQSKETNTDTEGCLSFPNKVKKIKRPNSVKVKYQNVTGKWNEVSLTQFAARIFFHEYDHINGIVCMK